MLIILLLNFQSVLLISKVMAARKNQMSLSHSLTTVLCSLCAEYISFPVIFV